MKLLVSIFLACLLSNSTLAQNYLYKYIDPCTGNMKSITIPSNGNVTVSYYGSVKTFATSEMTDGTFETWANGIYNSAGSVNPCSEVVGLGTAVNVNQSQALGILNILNSLSTAMDYMDGGATDMLGGSLNSVDNAGGSQKKKTNSSNGNTNTSSAGNTNVTEGNQGSNSQSTTAPNSELSGTSNNNSSQNNTQSNDNVGNNSSSGSSGSNSGNNTNSSSNDNTNGGTSGNQSTNSQPGGSTPGSKGNSGSIEGQNKSNNQSNDGNGNNTGNSSSPGNSSDNTSSNSNGNTTSGGTTNGEGNSGTQTTAGKSESDVTKTETPGGTETDKAEPTGGKTDITSGSSNSVKEAMSKNGKPTIIASGDFIGFNFKNQDAAYGSKVTGGYTSVKWNGLRTSGLLFDYTSAIKGPNITGFTAWIKPKAVTLVSTTATFGFEGFGSQYGTLAVGQIRKFKKIKKLKLAYVATFTFGQVYKTKFIGTAAIVGAMYDIKLHKRLDIKLTNLFIYAPYVSYHNDIVMKSPYVMLPSVGFNIGITKRFKFNINAGGAWAIKDKAMNYTVICGTRFIL